MFCSYLIRVLDNLGNLFPDLSWTVRVRGWGSRRLRGRLRSSGRFCRWLRSRRYSRSSCRLLRNVHLDASSVEPSICLKRLMITSDHVVICLTSLDRIFTAGLVDILKSAAAHSRKPCPFVGVR